MFKQSHSEFTKNEQNQFTYREIYQLPGFI